MPPANILTCDFVNTCTDYKIEVQGSVDQKFTNSFQVPGTEITLKSSNENAKFLQANSDNGETFELNLAFNEPNINIGLYKFEFNVFINCDDDYCFEANDYISFIVETSSLSNKQVSKLKEEKISIADITDQTKWNKRSVDVALNNEGESLKVRFLLFS